MPNADSFTSNWMFAAGVALMTAVMLRMLWRRHRRRPRTHSHQTKPPRHSSPLLDAPADIGRWQVEMYDLARELKAELDTKARVCQEMIRQARIERERLEALLERVRRVS